MDNAVIEIANPHWVLPASNDDWIAALEAGKVLYFPELCFQLQEDEIRLLRPGIRHPKARNISFTADNRLRGATGSAEELRVLSSMAGRFRGQATSLIHTLLPAYTPFLQVGPVSYRPTDVATREQSLRANDRLLHVDAFPSRPNHGGRILRVFSNIHPAGQARVWRIGEPFENVARRFLPRARPYSGWRASMLKTLHVTKSLRSEYDHLMLEIHHAMKADAHYQYTAPQQRMPFAAGSTWVCFSDQTPHAVSAGQYLIEQTLHLQPQHQYAPQASPLAILRRLSGRALVPAA